MRKLTKIVIPIMFFVMGTHAAEVKKRRPRPKPPVERERNAKPIAKKPANKEALVVVEGAMVYSAASFDAPVVSYLPANKKVEISAKTYGPFYRVKIKKGSYGFISDVDLQILGEMAKGKSPKNQPVAENKTKSTDDGIERFDNRRPIDETKAMGLNISMLNYSEKIKGQEPISNVYMVGLKFSGPGLLLATPMDINLAMSLSPPGYYSDYAVNGSKPAGYLIYSDLLLQFPVLSSDSTMIFIGLGPFLSYLNAKTMTVSGIENTSATRFGAEAMIGLGLRMGKSIVKFEGKYFYEGGQPFTGATIGLLYAR